MRAIGGAPGENMLLRFDVEGGGVRATGSSDCGGGVRATGPRLPLRPRSILGLGVSIVLGVNPTLGVTFAAVDGVATDGGMGVPVLSGGIMSDARVDRRWNWAADWLGSAGGA